MDSISYLYNAGNLLGNPILKSYIFKKCYDHAEEENLSFSVKSRDVLLRCPKCLNERSQNNTTYRTKAEVKDRFSAKLARKKSLTKFQWKYLKKAGAGNHNAMVITCRICGHVFVKKMKKPEKPVKEKPPEQQRPKKKKRKDRYSGLNVKAIANVKEASTPREDRPAKHKGLLQDAKSAKRYKSKLSDLLSAKTKTSKGLKAFLESI